MMKTAGHREATVYFIGLVLACMQLALAALELIL